jgi:hypothetical protein
METAASIPLSLIPQQARVTSSSNNKAKKRRKPKPKKNPKKIKRRKGDTVDQQVGQEVEHEEQQLAEEEQRQQSQREEEKNCHQQLENDSNNFVDDNSRTTATTNSEPIFSVLLVPEKGDTKIVDVPADEENGDDLPCEKQEGGINGVNHRSESYDKVEELKSMNDDPEMIVKSSMAQAEGSQNVTRNGTKKSSDEGKPSTVQTGTKTIESEENTPRTKSRKTLELVRAKLVRARLKKIVMEERIRKEQVERDSAEKEDSGNNMIDVTDVPAALSSDSNNSTKAHDTADALERARSKLQVALKKRYRAQGGTTIPMRALIPSERTSTQSTTSNNTTRLPPLSGLSASLVIRDVASTGPPEMVFFPHSSLELDLGRSKLIARLGEKVMRDLYTQDCTTDSRRIVGNDEDEKYTFPATHSLASRKRQLQQELMALQEKLERTQQLTESPILLEEDGGNSDARKSTEKSNNSIADSKNDSSVSNKQRRPEQQQQQINPSPPIIPFTKEELERRKVEAQNFMDISYWKHFVSKQEHLLSQVTHQVEEKTNAMEDCRLEATSIEEELDAVEEELVGYQARQEAVEDGIGRSMRQLLEVRQALYNEQQRLSFIADTKTTTATVAATPTIHSQKAKEAL